MIRSLLITAAVLGSTLVATAPSSIQALDDTPWTLPSTPPRCTQDEAARFWSPLTKSGARPESTTTRTGRR